MAINGGKPKQSAERPKLKKKADESKEASQSSQLSDRKKKPLLMKRDGDNATNSLSSGSGLKMGEGFKAKLNTLAKKKLMPSKAPASMPAPIVPPLKPKPAVTKVSTA